MYGYLIGYTRRYLFVGGIGGVFFAGLAGAAGDRDGAGSGLDGEVVAAASKAIIAGSQRLNIDPARTDIGVVLILRDLVILCAFSSAPRHLQLCTAYCREFFPLCLYPKV